MVVVVVVVVVVAAVDVRADCRTQLKNKPLTCPSHRIGIKASQMDGLHVQVQPVRFKVERCEAVQQLSPDCLLQDLSLLQLRQAMAGLMVLWRWRSPCLQKLISEWPILRLWHSHKVDKAHYDACMTYTDSTNSEGAMHKQHHCPIHPVDRIILRH